MSWNYRVMRREGTQVLNGRAHNWTTYGIYEVYYRDDGSIEMWSDAPMDPHGEDFEELRRDFDLMVRAFDKPILSYNELEKSVKPRHDDLRRQHLPFPTDVFDCGNQPGPCTCGVHSPKATLVPKGYKTRALRDLYEGQRLSLEKKKGAKSAPSRRAKKMATRSKSMRASARR